MHSYGSVDWGTMNGLRRFLPANSKKARYKNQFVMEKWHFFYSCLWIFCSALRERLISLWERSGACTNSTACFTPQHQASHWWISPEPGNLSVRPHDWLLRRGHSPDNTRPHWMYSTLDGGPRVLAWSFLLTPTAGHPVRAGSLICFPLLSAF